MCIPLHEGSQHHGFAIIGDLLILLTQDALDVENPGQLASGAFGAQGYWVLLLLTVDGIGWMGLDIPFNQVKW